MPAFDASSRMLRDRFSASFSFSRLQRFSAGILAQATENKRADFKFSL